MAIKLCFHYCIRPGQFKDLLALRLFRKKREATTEGGAYSFDCAIYCEVAEKLGLSAEYVENLVYRWIYNAPLKYLNCCSDKRLSGIIKKARENGIIIATFSDYPTKDKLIALHMEVDAQFSATDPEINALKPDIKGLHTIIETMGIDAGQCLMVGDRDDKDGECARRAAIDYLILPPSRCARKRAIQALKNMLFDESDS